MKHYKSPPSHSLLKQKSTCHSHLRKKTKHLQLQPNTVIERGAVYIRHLAQEGMGDSAWTVMTDINLKLVDDFITQVTNELYRGNKAPPPPFDSYILYHRLKMGLASRNDQLKTVTTRFSILGNAIFSHASSRSRRAIFVGGGEPMNWLFGVTTVKQFTTLDAKTKPLHMHNYTPTTAISIFRGRKTLERGVVTCKSIHVTPRFAPRITPRSTQRIAPHVTPHERSPQPTSKRGPPQRDVREGKDQRDAKEAIKNLRRPGQRHSFLNIS